MDPAYSTKSEQSQQVCETERDGRGLVADIWY
jgi:hypothetical protein